MELMEANLNDVMYKPEFAEYNSWAGSLLSVATDIALGMSYLHSQSVLHCDLKPANILISAQVHVHLACGMCMWHVACGMCM